MALIFINIACLKTKPPASGALIAGSVQTSPMIRILLVEDDLVNQKLAGQMLGQWGMHVVTANDGSEALVMLEKEKFDLVLMDINLPGIDGFETTRFIRNKSGQYFQRLPILAFTASSLADNRDKMMACGMNDVVSKPVNPSEMHCKLNKYILGALVNERPLRIRFDLFSDSTSEFRLELVSLMIRNLRELQQAAYTTYYTSESRSFGKACHKVKSTLMLLDDNEFVFAVDDLRINFDQLANQDILRTKIVRFSFMVESIIKTLEVKTDQLNVPASTMNMRVHSGA